MRTAIVAPVHVPVSEKWVKALDIQRQFADIIIVDDSDGKVDLEGWFDTYNYAEQEKALGPELYKLFRQFHHSAACKQFGLWQAWKLGYDVVIVIDSDCIVPEDFVIQHFNSLLIPGDVWTNPLTRIELHPRGYPYHLRNVPKWAHMGMWEGVLDLYGKDRKQDEPKFPSGVRDVTDVSFFPLSGMNVSFVREALPYMLFLPNFDVKGKEVKRHDDIWGGYIFQKMAQRMTRSLSYGRPFVFHDTVIVAEEDARDEEPMIDNESEFYSFVDGAFRVGYLKPWDALHRCATLGETFAGLAKAFEFQIKAFV